MKKFYILIFISILIVLSPNALKAESSEPNKNVLYLSSYGTDWNTVPLQTKGLTDSLDSRVHLYYEFMDTKHVSYTDTYKANFYVFFKNKYSVLLKSFDLIIVADDNALDFVSTYYDDLFYNLPIVFMGINSLKDANDAHDSINATGILETFSYDDNFTLAKRMLPNAKKIVLLYDNSNESDGALVQFYETYNKSYLDYSLTTINTSNITYEDLLEKLSKINSTSLNFHITTNNTLDKTSFTNEENITLYEHLAKAPWFANNQIYLGKYIMGCVFYDHYSAAYRAGGNVNNILFFNYNPSNIGISVTPFNLAYVDYNLADEFGLSLSNIPANTVVINKPANIITRNPLVSTLIILAFILILLFVFEIIYYRRKFAEQNSAFSKQNEILNYLNYNDALTDVKNRTSFTLESEELIHKSTPFYLLFCDIDDFKSINDTHGHVLADSILRQIAKKFKTLEDAYTKIYRYAGDEFIVVFIAQDEKLVRSQINHINNKIKGVYQVRNINVDITFTMGISKFPDTSNTLQDLVASADSAMYYSKNIAHKSFEFYNESLHFQYKNTLYIKNILKDAINRNGFYLTYKPIIDPKNQKISAIETRLMLRNSKVGTDVFLAVAESTGLMVDVGRIAAKLTIEFLARTKEKGLPLYRTYCVFSPYQLIDDDYDNYLEGLFVSNKVDYEYFGLTTWESREALIKQTNLKKLVRYFSLKNISLVLDRFGNNDGSLNLLFSLPLSYVRIKKDFVLNLVEHETSLKHLFIFVHSLGISIIAEGNSSRSNLNKLELAGVDLIEGFFYNYPLSEEEFFFTFYKDHKNF